MQKVQRYLTDKELRIVHYFYEHDEGYVREINQKIGLPQHTLLKYLKELEKKNILISQFKGNVKIFVLNKYNKLVPIIFSYFNYMELELLEYVRKKAIEDFREGIKKIKLPYFILLFGSSTKGNYKESSDIDIIIIYDSIFNDTIKKINELKKEITSIRGLTINYIVITLREFLKEKENQQNFALQDALVTGYPILGNNLYYEVTL